MSPGVDVPAVDVSGFAQAIADLAAVFGSGAAGGAAAALRQASAGVDGVCAASCDSIDGLYAAWRGGAGDAAMDSAMRVRTAAATMADRGNAMAEMVDRAAGVIAAGQREIEAILRSFGETVASLGAEGLGPGGTALIVSEAIDHLGRALRVVERVRGELDTETAAMSELISPPPTPEPAAATAPEPARAPAVSPVAADVVSAGVGAPAAAVARPVAATGAGSGGATEAIFGGMRTVAASTGGASERSGGTGRGGGGRGDVGRVDTGESQTTATGVKLTLPDGSTVEAPNQQAADAVRHALDALGTPYVWGGTTPGAGLDCSGLTQWAYAEAGVRLPRLAQEQGYGHPQIGPGDLMPGDLAVWDGHVAMVIGNGQLVEAGDPVQIGPIRTENIGMQFLGFYRPTA
ncbi:C40 family peptidase [Nocardia sp. 2]|uniref:C40 family peptidase n=1 Tax=Nocardia acididurans TaxID=2802282 RepID=A0ABS1M2V6_9NOCA|nr:C40 family peptidase [Nocardia acididurans]MBL1075003.1 C40 family peptidase [Nocardia acididurans]